MSRKERRKAKRIQQRERQRQKRGNLMTRKEVSQKSFQVAFAVTIMALTDLHPEIGLDLRNLVNRINNILKEFNTIGNKELELLIDVMEEEFKINLKGL